MNISNKVSVCISLLVIWTYAGWASGGGRATNSFDAFVKVKDGDTLKLSWQASIDINDDCESEVKNCNYNVIIKSVFDERDNINLIGICNKEEVNAKIYVKDFSSWCKRAIQSEVIDYCGRKSKKNEKLFVEVKIFEFIVNEEDRHNVEAEVQLFLKTESNPKTVYKVVKFKYDTWGKTLNPYLYQKAISNIIVKISGAILSTAVEY